MTRNVLTHSVFVGLYPAPETAPAFGALQRSLQGDGIDSGMMPFDRLHVSLIGLGDGFEAPGPRWIQGIADRLDRVGLPPFRISLNSLATFQSSKRVRPVVLAGEEGVIGISMLCKAIGSRLRDRGFGHRPAAEPHVTLAWSDMVVPQRYVEPVSWTVKEFVLIDSIQGAGRHEVLGRWTLGRSPENHAAADLGPLFD